MVVLGGPRLHQAGLLQPAQVMRDGRRTQLEDRGQLFHRIVLPGQQADNLETLLVGQDLEELEQVFCLLHLCVHHVPLIMLIDIEMILPRSRDPCQGFGQETRRLLRGPDLRD